MLVLAPLAVAYRTGRFFHSRFLLRPSLGNRSHLLPLIVMGSLRAGGSGKTPTVSELALYLSTQGKRVGILAYWLTNPGLNKPGGFQKDPIEVFRDSDWRTTSDEAVLLARETNARVFVTRNREQAWDELSRSGEFDLLISDDGLMDPRLSDAFKIVLREAGESPGIFDLLPSGSYHLTTAALKDADYVGGCERELIFPRGFDFTKLYWAFCGIGNPENFQQNLLSAGVRLAGFTASRDHILPDLEKVKTQGEKVGAHGFLCTAKDGIKLGSFPAIVIRERIRLEPGLILAIEQYLRPRSSS